MYNKKVVQLEQDLISLIGNSGLHIATVKLIMDKVSRMINDTLAEELKKEDVSSVDNTNE